MRNNSWISLALFTLLLTACQTNQNPQVREKKDHVILQNEWVFFEFNLQTGRYNLYDADKNQAVVSGAVFKMDHWRSDLDDLERNFESYAVNNEFGEGLGLSLRMSGSDYPEITFTATVYKEYPFIEFGTEVQNTGERDLQIKDVYALADGQLYQNADLSENFAMIDGFSGGEPLEYGRRMYSPLTRRNALKSRNNILLTFTDNNQRNTLVMGGLNYADYEKFAYIEQQRRVELDRGSDGTESLLAYLNLPLDSMSIAPDGEKLRLVNKVQSRKWQYYEFHCSESATTAQDPEHIVIELTNLQKDQPYNIGFSWWRSLWHGDRKDHYQSVFLEYQKNGKAVRVPWFENEVIPRFDGRKKEQIEQIEVPLPQEAVNAGTVRFIVEHGSKELKPDPNVYLSEFWLRDGKFKTLYPNQFTSVDSVELPRKIFKAQLFAHDPVGKRIEPGQTYECPDRFYLSLTNSDPFEALESYGQSVAKAQAINLPMYDFPTVCLWYAEHGGYGGGMAENTTLGAVNEMSHIKNAGFLNYSRAAVRLVPDSYMPNNQQGWWDDEHWQKPVDIHNGSMNGRYVKPYETSEKWGQTVTDLGGIPLTYFQTGYRSEDYAKTFPQHMLFNKTYAWKGAEYDTTGPLFTDWHQTWARNGRVWGYDYSDPDFIRHMKEVYANLKEGGIRGLMFDYPFSGWASQGGLENKDWTAARAYRNIFKLASEGLGPQAYVHERNMQRGSDLSIGTVASMRTENDTDRMDGTTVTRCGLRWYKNRVLYNQDTDSKNLVRLEDNPDAVRAVITMAYVTTGRLLLANSFAQMSAETIYDLTRSYPYHQTHKSARPVDAFVNDTPQVYDFEISNDWHQVTFYNPDFDHPSDISIRLSGQTVDGALSLDPLADYYIYDFWNDQLAATLKGTEILSQQLRPGEARMLSVRKKVDHPQVVSTNRHLMQGYLDLKNVSWNPETKELSGSCDVITGDPFVITIAPNAYHPAPDQNLENNGELLRLTLRVEESQSVTWTVKFE